MSESQKIELEWAAKHEDAMRRLFKWGRRYDLKTGHAYAGRTLRIYQPREEAAFTVAWELGAGHVDVQAKHAIAAKFVVALDYLADRLKEAVVRT